MADNHVDRMECHTYTHARRHPIVIGQIGGWSPPFQLTLAQIGVLFVVFLFELKTWRWWGTLLPKAMGVVVALALPVAAAWLLRRVRLEGRSVARAAVGGLAFLLTPATGLVGGRRHRTSPASDLRRARVFVAGEGP
jgi:conjugation transfer TcpE-like protein